MGAFSVNKLNYFQTLYAMKNRHLTTNLAQQTVPPALTALAGLTQEKSLNLHSLIPHHLTTPSHNTTPNLISHNGDTRGLQPSVLMVSLGNIQFSFLNNSVRAIHFDAVIGYPNPYYTSFI